jgi:hypothetical protein
MKVADSGHVVDRFRLRMHILPATDVRMFLPSGKKLETNALFDSRSVDEFLLFTAAVPADDISADPRDQGIAEESYDSLKGGIRRDECFKADSLTIGGIIHRTVEPVYALETSESSLVTFGDLRVAMVIGAPFFKRFSRVYHNYPARRLDFEP